MYEIIILCVASFLRSNDRVFISGVYEMSKRKKRIIFVLLIITFVILLFPFPFSIKDGGSHGYSAIVYEVTFWRPMEDGERGITIKMFRLIEFYIKQ